MQMPAVCSHKTLDIDMATLSSYPPLIYPSPASPSPAAPPLPSQDDLKRAAAHRAVDHVRSGMVLGLGTGSTAIHALQRIADLLSSGELTDIVGIATSKKTEGEAKALGIPLADLGSNPNIDLSIDGADEVDPFLNLVKGRGGSLLREKMIEGASKKFVVIVDESKWVEKLGGSKMAVPVEIIPFGWKYTLMRLKRMFEGKAGFDARLRMKGEEIFVTDNLNYIIELFFENGIEGDLNEISDEILRTVGVVEHGMFLGMATEVIIAGKDGMIVKNKEEQRR